MRKKLYFAKIKEFDRSPPSFKILSISTMANRISRNWPVSVPTRVESRMRLELDRSFGRIIDWKLKQHPSFGRVVLPCAVRTRRLVVDSPTVRGRRRGDSCLATDWPRSMRVALRLTLLRASSCRDRARGRRRLGLGWRRTGNNEEYRRFVPDFIEFYFYKIKM